MELTIVSPFEKKVIQIAWIEVNTPVGNFVMQRGHAPMIVSLSPNNNITMCLANGKHETLAAQQGGLLEINRTQARLLLHA